MPVHGKSLLKVNGEEFLSDFGGEILEFEGKKFIIDCEMPTLVIVEGKCDNCEGKWYVQYSKPIRLHLKLDSLLNRVYSYIF